MSKRVTLKHLKPAVASLTALFKEIDELDPGAEITQEAALKALEEGLYDLEQSIMELDEQKEALEGLKEKLQAALDSIEE